MHTSFAARLVRNIVGSVLGLAGVVLATAADWPQFCFMIYDSSAGTIDGGKTWQLAAPLPAGFSAGRVGPNYAWDPNANIFYASTMGKPTIKLQR